MDIEYIKTIKIPLSIKLIRSKFFNRPFLFANKVFILFGFIKFKQESKKHYIVLGKLF